MAYNQDQYNSMESAYEKMNYQQRQDAVNQYKDNADFQSFVKDYANGGYGRYQHSASSTPAPTNDSASFSN